jgi:hypothetical protein
MAHGDIMRARNMQRKAIAMHTSRILRYKNRANIIGMADELPNTLSCAGNPHADDALRTARDNHVALRVDRKCIY